MTAGKSSESRYLYDALSFTSKVDSKENIISVLGLDYADIPWETISGAKGYHHRLYFMGISIHFDSGNPDQNVWCEMSGQGCRAFEQFGSGDYDYIFQWIFDEPNDRHFTRLDVAFDDRDTQLIDLGRLWCELEERNYVSKSKWQREDNSDGGRTIYLGSKHSEMFFRIYDKAKERGYDDMHWVRLELQLRRDYASSFVLNPAPLNEKFIGVLAKQWRFIEPSTDSNKSRCENAYWWDELINGAIAITLFDKPELEYNLSHLDRFVFKMSGQAALAAVSIYGVEEYINKLNDVSWKMYNNPKYRELIERCAEIEVFT